MRYLAMSSMFLRTMLVATVASGLLAGCNVKRPELVDGQIVLDELGGPEIDGVNATLERSARQAMKAGDFNRAGQMYRQLVDNEKHNSRFLLGYAESMRRDGEMDAALMAYSGLLQVYPDNLEGMEGLALALLEKGEFEKAGDLFSRVMKKDARRWRTLNGLGILFMTLERHPEAIAYFTEALTHSSNNVSVLNNVGLTLAIQNRPHEALEALEKAVELAPNKLLRRHIEMNLAMVYGVTGDMRRARKYAGRHLSGPTLDNNLGFYAHLAADDALAKSYLNMALTKSPRHYERAWQNLSQIESQENMARSRAIGKAKHVKVE